MTFRPRWARRVIYPSAAVLVLVMLVGALFLPPLYRTVDRVGLVVVALILAYLLHRLADVRIEADEAGLTVVNLVRRPRLEWAEVLRVQLKPGEPWVVLDLADGESLPAMGIQGSDGAYAREQAARLARLVAERSRTARDD
jgi:hypothetical protein